MSETNPGDSEEAEGLLNMIYYADQKYIWQWKVSAGELRNIWKQFGIKKKHCHQTISENQNLITSHKCPSLVQ